MKTVMPRPDLILVSQFSSLADNIAAGHGAADFDGDGIASYRDHFVGALGTPTHGAPVVANDEQVKSFCVPVSEPAYGKSGARAVNDAHVLSTAPVDFATSLSPSVDPRSDCIGHLAANRTAKLCVLTAGK